MQLADHVVEVIVCTLLGYIRISLILVVLERVIETHTVEYTVEYCTSTDVHHAVKLESIARGAARVMMVRPRRGGGVHDGARRGGAALSATGRLGPRVIYPRLHLRLEPLGCGQRQPIRPS